MQHIAVFPGSHLQKKLTNMSTTTLAASRHSNKWIALAILCTAQFMVIMDTSIIGVALPAIQRSLDYTASGLQWIFNAYVILFGGFLLLGGKLSDVYGPKKVFMAGFVILTAASLFAGLAWNDVSLNIGRAIQGFGSALIAPAALTLLMTIFTDGRELGKAFGFWGAAAAAGGSAGVFLGGLLTEYLDWRWTFYINIPIGLFVMLAGARILVPGNTNKSRIDYTGAFLITGALVLLVYALVTGEQNGWGSAATVLMLLASVVLFLVFGIRQKKTAAPLVPLSIFKAPNLTAGNIVMGLLAGAWIPLWFFLNLYLQQTLGYTAFYSGLALLPMTIAIMIFMIGITGKLIAAFGTKKTLLAGLVLLTVSLAWFATASTGGSYMADVFGPSLLGAIGMSLAYIPATMTSISGVKPQESGLASGIVNTTYQVGSAIGLAVAVAISSAISSSMTETGVEQAIAANEGFQSAFIAAMIISLLSILVASGIRKQGNQ